MNPALFRTDLKLRNIPGYWQGGKKKDKPKDHAPRSTDPAFHAWKLCCMWEFLYLPCLERSRAPAQCNAGVGAGG